MHQDPTVPREVTEPIRPSPVTVALLVLPALAAVAVPLYARVTPRLAGVPFFYWYQFGCLLLTALCLAVALRLRKPGTT